MKRTGPVEIQFGLEIKVPHEATKKRPIPHKVHEGHGERLPIHLIPEMAPFFVPFVNFVRNCSVSVSFVRHDP